MNINQLIESKEQFYGVSLDAADPFLERNLARLEMRFEERYECSLKKETERKEQRKAVHKTVSKSLLENKGRLEAVRELRHYFAQRTICANA